MGKITIEDVRQEAANHSWQVVTPIYTNLSTEMEFICEEGHHVFKPYKLIRDKFECPVCKNNRYKDSFLMIVPPKGKEFRLLALDQATVISGWSLYDGDKLVKYGKIVVNESLPTVERISFVRQWLINALDTMKPDMVVFEDIQLQDLGPANQKSTIGVTTFKILAELLGVIENVLNDSQIQHKSVYCATWRADVGVKGKSRSDKKRSAQNLVKQWFDVKVTEDEADAICIGRYGTHHFGKQNHIVSWK